MKEKARPHTYSILIVITGCGGGDWPPLLALAVGLRRAGHSLRVVCDNSTVEAVKAVGLTPLCLPQSHDLANLFEPAIARLLSGQEIMSAGGDSPFVNWARSCVDLIVRSLQGWQPALVITSLFGLELGEMLARRFLVLRCFLNPSFYFSESEEEIWSRDFSEIGGQMYRRWLLPQAKSANLVLHATDRTFDFCTDHPSSHHKYVGPMFWEMAGNGLHMLQKPGPPWVLITLSTSPQPRDLTIVKTALESLEPIDVRVMVTLAPGHDQSALGRIPDNAHVAGYIPHSKVLPHCCLVISHAGHGIVMKAMKYGVPMVLVPWGRDQPGVAMRAERLGTATVVARESCCVETLSEAISEVMNNPGYREQSRLASMRLRNIDGVADGVEQVQLFMDKS
ncbi:MAG: glycosyltransferase [Desulforhopalus sp.]